MHLIDRSTRQFSLASKLAVALIFLLLGAGWSYASPHGSSADDGFHLTSIWCAQGPSAYCTPAGDEFGAFVPRVIAYPSCFVSFPAQRSAACVNEIPYEPIYVDYFNRPGSNYPFGFHWTMGLLAGKDVEVSVQAMRIANVVLAALLLFATLMVVPAAIARAVAVSWGVGVIPVGIFFIASTSPSSWAITGIGVLWALILAAARSRQFRTRFFVQLALAGVAVALILLSRRDGGWYIAVSALAVIILIAGQRRLLSTKALLATAAFLVLGAATIYATWNGFLVSVVNLPGAQTATDQPNPFIKTLLEVPSFFVALVGGQEPAVIISNSGAKQGQSGYFPTGLTYGIGWTEFALPSLVGLMMLAVLVIVVTAGFNRYSKARVLAFSIVLVSIPVHILGVRVLTISNSGQFIQPRYVVPILIPLVAIAVLNSVTVTASLNRFQTVVVGIGLVLAGSLAWLATASRYAVGPEAAYTNFGQAADWWWPFGPSRLVWFLIVTVLTSVWAFVTVGKFGASRVTPMNQSTRGDLVRG